MVAVNLTFNFFYITYTTSVILESWRLLDYNWTTGASLIYRDFIFVCWLWLSRCNCLSSSSDVSRSKNCFQLRVLWVSWHVKVPPPKTEAYWGWDVELRWAWKLKLKSKFVVNMSYIVKLVYIYWERFDKLNIFMYNTSKSVPAPVVIFHLHSKMLLKIWKTKAETLKATARSVNAASRRNKILLTRESELWGTWRSTILASSHNLTFKSRLENDWCVKSNHKIREETECCKTCNVC